MDDLDVDKMTEIELKIEVIKLRRMVKFYRQRVKKLERLLKKTK